MALTRSKIEKNLLRIRGEIADACARRGRSEDDVAVIPVTKSVEMDEIRLLIDLGFTDLAESRVQQLCERSGELAAYLQRRRTPPHEVRWHMVGHLQRNKVKAVLANADVIHSVDSLRLAEEINVRAEQLGRTVDVMLEVNCGDEPQKFGCAVGAALHLGELVTTLKSLRLVGLMTMAALSDNAEAARPTFVRLREVFEEMYAEGIAGPGFRHLSMGMSQDYIVAVEEGATMCRIGTAIFA